MADYDLIKINTLFEIPALNEGVMKESSPFVASPAHQEALGFPGELVDNWQEKAIEKFGSGKSPYEDEKIVWRGDRIEWLLAHGFQDWFASELSHGRAVVPSSL